MKKYVMIFSIVVIILCVAVFQNNRMKDSRNETQYPKSSDYAVDNSTSSSVTNNYSYSKSETTIQNKYDSLTNSEKKKICEYIQERYDYYDSIYGGYSGDIYSDTIFQEASEKYGLTVEELNIIWMKMYTYD